MLTTVYFATNRAMTGPSGDWRSYGADIARPSDPGAITYATAFVDNTNLTADKTGAIQQIQNVQRGGFSQAAIDDLSDPGRNLLVFVHERLHARFRVEIATRCLRIWLECNRCKLLRIIMKSRCAIQSGRVGLRMWLETAHSVR